MATDNTNLKLLSTDRRDDVEANAETQRCSATAARIVTDISFCYRCGEIVTGMFCPRCGSKQCTSCGDA